MPVGSSVQTCGDLVWPVASVVLSLDDGHDFTLVDKKCERLGQLVGSFGIAVVAGFAAGFRPPVSTDDGHELTLGRMFFRIAIRGEAA